MKILQNLLINFVRASLWPAYMGLLSVIARSGPWPRSLGRPAGFIFAVLALMVFVTLLLRRSSVTTVGCIRSLNCPMTSSGNSNARSTL